MAQSREFPHLTLPLVIKQRARLNGGGKVGAQEKINKANREQHHQNLVSSSTEAINYWQEVRAQREQSNLPDLPHEIPLLIKTEPESDVEFLKKYYDFEVVSEDQDGTIVVASSNERLAEFINKTQDFVQGKKGTATVAKIYELIPSSNISLRLEKILSPWLLEQWSLVVDSNSYIVEIGVECLGSEVLPDPPEMGDGTDYEKFQRKLGVWQETKRQLEISWDDLKTERESSLINIVLAYNGEILDIVHDEHSGFSYLPDSFSVKVKISGLGLKDIAINYPFVFEIKESDEVDSITFDDSRNQSDSSLEVEPPDVGAPAVCVIDSGIQEGHKLLSAAIDRPTSICFVPQSSSSDVADYVNPFGHGTRVAGAIVYPDTIPDNGRYKPNCWIQNARVLNNNNKLPVELYPPLYLRKTVERFSQSDKKTKLFNHSIASSVPCKTKYMSAWAAEIDFLTWQYDVLFIQSAGNLGHYGTGSVRLGVLDHFNSGTFYPEYLLKPSSRIPSPSESLQAITVGSIARDSYNNGLLESIASKDMTSGFSTTGPGIWNTIKPEVVEYGGDYVINSTQPYQITTPAEVCEELVSSTMYGGSYKSKNAVGTSFSAPKVAAIAAAIQASLPNEPSILYRGLIINSARWPNWTSSNANKLEVIRQIGYGIPDLERATENNPYRITLLTSGEHKITAKQAHIFQIPIPDSIRRQSDEYKIRIDVTLSYTAKPRRTRRHIRNYLSTWADWKSSKLGESLESFKNRVLHEATSDDEDGEGVIPWNLREKDNWGSIIGIKRSNSTVQKDWVELNSYQLPVDFCIAVVGHNGWDKDPDAFAKYALVVTFEVVGQEVEIYEQISIGIEALIQIQRQEIQVTL